MRHVLFPRMLAGACWLLAAWTLGRAIYLSPLPEESWRRTAARVIFALCLAELGRVAWRRPKGRSRRVRRRVLATLEVLARPELEEEYAASTPSVPFREAILTDWRDVRGHLAEPPDGAFSPPELVALRAFDAEVGRLADPDGSVGSEAAWGRLRQAAARAFEAATGG